LVELVWREEYTVGVSELDRQHQIIIQLINELGAADQTPDRADTPAETIAGILDRLTDYVTTHFALEENYMERFDYGAYEGHLEEHLRYIRTIGDLTQDQMDRKDSVSAELIDFLNEWWINHILSEDKKYTKTFNDGGLE